MMTLPIRHRSLSASILLVVGTTLPFIGSANSDLQPWIESCERRHHAHCGAVNQMLTSSRPLHFPLGASENVHWLQSGGPRLKTDAMGAIAAVNRCLFREYGRRPVTDERARAFSNMGRHLHFGDQSAEFEQVMQTCIRFIKTHIADWEAARAKEVAANQAAATERARREREAAEQRAAAQAEQQAEARAASDARQREEIQASQDAFRNELSRALAESEQRMREAVESRLQKWGYPSAEAIYETRWLTDPKRLLSSAYRVQDAQKVEKAFAGTVAGIDRLAPGVVLQCPFHNEDYRATLWVQSDRKTALGLKDGLTPELVRILNTVIADADERELDSFWRNYSRQRPQRPHGTGRMRMAEWISMTSRPSSPLIHAISPWGGCINRETLVLRVDAIGACGAGNDPAMADFAETLEMQGLMTEKDLLKMFGGIAESLGQGERVARCEIVLGPDATLREKITFFEREATFDATSRAAFLEAIEKRRRELRASQESRGQF